ncbi:MAG: S26 family signal peptidase [Flavobacteriales bacterium]|nr:S26 family signal peptidase [Flavobacteriales bacterium]
MSIFEILLILLYLVYFVSLPSIFKRIGLPSWHGFVPVLQWITWLKAIKRPWYWVFVLFIPGVNLLMLGIMNVELGIAFTKESTKDQWYFGALPWAAIPDLAFRMKDVKYVGPRDWSKSKKSMMREWGEAILFAVIAASVIRSFFFEAYTIPTGSMEGSMLVGDYLFVSKMSYGAKVQQTPLSVPFVHNALPGSMTNSYVEWWSLPYFRLPGFGDVDRYDPVVFNFPHGDSVLVHPQLAGHDYYAIIRNRGVQIAGSYEAYDTDPEGYNEQARRSFTQSPRQPIGIKRRPVDKAENYIKRCIGLPGEDLEIRDRVVYINNEAIETPEGVQFNYKVALNNPLEIKRVKDKLELTDLDFGTTEQGLMDESTIALTASEVEKLKAMNVTASIELEDQSTTRGTMTIFPNSQQAPYDSWDVDNFGPLHIPAKGESIDLNLDNLPLYRRAISVYEDNELEVKDGVIYINGELASSYTFQQDYFWMMGDNRHNSADARMWGFVPEDHIVGKAVFTWFSKQNEVQHGESKIRWERMFRTVD